MDVLMVCIGIASLGLMYWQVRIMQAASPAPVVLSEGQPKRLSYWPVVGMGILAIATWIPYFLHLGEPERVMAMDAWGGLQDGCYVVMDGTKLQHYSDRYNILLACGVSNPTVDQMQDSLITVSSAFSIANGPIPIEAKYTQGLTDQIKSLATSTPPQPYQVWHSVFLFPKKGDISRIKRVADVREFGGKIVNNCEPIE